MAVKARKVGNSTVLTVPAEIKVADEYDVYQGRDGQIVYTPKERNPFLNPEFIATHDLTQKEEFGGHLVGNEIPQD
ncbi:type II toxin-antitoxin system PemI/MazE family antitoxin [Levilactobacillus koreensis]|uniref:Antitoxin of toxin-antitoxin stability system n=1 Tax=Levilactobacillus koreensis TaxID=637971 RepID=A0AAC8UU11_9LACO|nr:hypothetical protein [Levilactobacillus koreensis]AKP64386.1 antitoxin of toxin-antitoxin stability system [Levilactobacillus koreensis]